MYSDTNARILKVVNNVTSGKTNQVNFDKDIKTELAFDSVQLVELFAALEMEFQTELPLKLMTVRTGKEFLQMLDDVLSENKAQ